MSTRIQPTPGRVVWWAPSKGSNIPCHEGQPLAAIIAGVVSDDVVNLAAFDAHGAHHALRNVRLFQGDERICRDRHACFWMPYQMGQAAKTEDTAANVERTVNGQGLLLAEVQSSLDDLVGRVEDIEDKLNAEPQEGDAAPEGKKDAAPPEAAKAGKDKK